MQPHDLEIWENVKQNLKAKNAGNKMVQTWFGPTELMSVDVVDDVLRIILGVPSELHKYWITENIYDRICQEFEVFCRGPFQIDFAVTGRHNLELAEGPNLLHQVMNSNEGALPMTPVPASEARAFNNTANTGDRRDYLNPDYVFSTFVVGRNNEFAYAASSSIAQKPGEGYNPLFICGPTGMGKTHLLNAVGNFIREHNPHTRVCYVTAERFLNECVSSIRRREMEKFRQRYREKCDVLLMDDIQVLGRTEAVQEEFFHTLNNFFEKGQQVIIASDRMPKDIKGLEDRILTRLEWGLIADIQMPDIETRVAILRFKAERKRMRIPEDVINHIARISKRSIRELEGNLNKVKMFSELQGLDINLELSKRVLASHSEASSLTMDDLMQMVADHFKIRIVDIKSKNRTRPLVVPRQIAMFLVKKHLDKSLVEIGRAFGGKDHTTVINAIRRVESTQASDSDIRKDIDELESRINNITGV